MWCTYSWQIHQGPSLLLLLQLVLLRVQLVHLLVHGLQQQQWE
jgi:hypothetical protein